MKMQIWSIFSLLFTFLISCQSTSENHAYGYPPLTPEKTVFKPLEITFSDTNSPNAQAMIAALDSFYKREVARGFNGAVLIGSNGSILYERYYGYSNYTTKAKWNANTTSQLASTSKPFTATAILWLQQNGFLDIEQPVNKYLPDFPYKSITVKMLLNHRSGLPDYLKFVPNYWKDNDATMYNEDLMQILKKNKPRLMFTPNTRFKYCNTNYAVLARIIEEVTELKYAKFMSDFIFKPLGMNRTFVYDPNNNKPNNIAISYYANWKLHGDMFADGVYGDKGIYSTLRDMYKWDQSFYNYTILNKSTQKEAYTPYSFEIPGQKNYGLGWRMINGEDQYKVVYHNGWWHGNNTVFYRFIKDNITFIILGNRYNSNIYRQVKPIYAILKQYTKIEDIQELNSSDS